ncbi:hypothetical protein PV327_011166 [Microctonus hyperodae]|uniref:Chitin-binding type-4 domain-containing protein n=1 Tax=Microctonus hyperodae TaxID=165561 RepID=A0AA39EYJ2_MICHY|nr:hypothetical protein PV327_011166 [Microctonus hyperodae]
MPTTTLVVFLIFCSCGRSDDASVKYIRHGYVQIPASRAYLCMKHINVNCSDIIYEPQSIEQPTATILDGSTPIASGGNEKFSALDEYGVNRWNRQILHVYSYNQSHALFLLKWHFTAMHKTDLFYIHLTNRNYNVKEKLSKKMFEVERFCLSNAQGLIDNDYAMMCIVPKSQICCVDGAFLAVWVIGDTPNSHTQIVDVRFTIHHTNNTIHNDWNQTTPEDTTTILKLSPCTAYEIIWESYVKNSVTDLIEIIAKQLPVIVNDYIYFKLKKNAQHEILQLIKNVIGLDVLLRNHSWTINIQQNNVTTNNDAAHNFELDITTYCKQLHENKNVNKNASSVIGEKLFNNVQSFKQHTIYLPTLSDSTMENERNLVSPSSSLTTLYENNNRSNNNTYSPTKREMEKILEMLNNNAHKCHLLLLVTLYNIVDKHYTIYECRSLGQASKFAATIPQIALDFQKSNKEQDVIIAQPPEL